MIDRSVVHGSADDSDDRFDDDSNDRFLLFRPQRGVV